MASPVASIVVPAYNSERTIAETLRSLLRQTFADYEIVVVDDGSTDRTAEVVKSFADPKIRLIQQRNRGLAGAHNSGIHAARGEFIGFCDADDLWLPEKLERHVAHLRARPEVGISYSGSLIIDGDGVAVGVAQRPRLRNVTAAHIFKRNPIGNGSAAVIRRAALDDFAYRPLGETERDWWFDESFRQSDDIEAWTRFALTRDWRFEGVPGLLTLYRVHGGGLSANVERQYETWRRMRDKVAAIAPRFVERHGGLAAAYQLRYLARRAVSARDGATARRLSRAALKSSWRLWLEEPRKTLTTVAAAEVLAIFGADLYARAERLALASKNA